MFEIGQHLLNMLTICKVALIGRTRRLCSESDSSSYLTTLRFLSSEKMKLQKELANR
jgi:hypothetical protein